MENTKGKTGFGERTRKRFFSALDKDDSAIGQGQANLHWAYKGACWPIRIYGKFPAKGDASAGTFSGMVSETYALLISYKEILAADGAEACVPVVVRADDGVVSRGGINFGYA